MKIGITERGDAGINLAWTEKMNTVVGRKHQHGYAHESPRQ